MAQTDEPRDIRCPWCPLTAVGLKPVLHHMEAQHRQRWADPALYPLVYPRTFYTDLNGLFCKAFKAAMQR
jgi:hypothetical protein